MTLIKCKNCKKEISSEAKQCVHCGELNIPTIKCPECNKSIEANSNICPKCGYPLKKESALQETAKKAVDVTKNVISTLSDEFDKIVTKK